MTQDRCFDKFNNYTWTQAIWDSGLDKESLIILFYISANLGWTEDKRDWVFTQSFVTMSKKLPVHEKTIGRKVMLLEKAGWLVFLGWKQHERYKSTKMYDVRIGKPIDENVLLAVKLEHEKQAEIKRRNGREPGNPTLRKTEVTRTTPQVTQDNSASYRG